MMPIRIFNKGRKLLIHAHAVLSFSAAVLKTKCSRDNRVCLNGERFLLFCLCDIRLDDLPCGFCCRC